MKKKIIRILTIIIMIASIFTLTSCGKKESDQTYAWVIATASPDDTVTQIYAEKFASEVDRLSNGKMRMEVYNNSSLGGDTELLESVMCGDIPFVVQNTAPQVSYMPKLALFDLPCVFDNIDQLHKILDNKKFMNKINEIYAQKNIELLGMSDQNFRVMSSNKNVNSLKDFKGIKIRTMENSYHMTFWNSIGANPSPMAFAEVYIGLQQKTIDAQENPYEVIVSNKFYEQQDYIVQTNHLPHLLSLITNQDFLNGLDKDQQVIIKKAAKTSCDYARIQAQKRVNDRIKICEDGGSTIVPVSKELKNEMRNKSKKVYQDIKKVVNDEELYNIYTGK